MSIPATTALAISVGPYQLTLDPHTGLLVGLQTADSPPALGHGGGPLPLGASLSGQPLQAEPRTISHITTDDSLTVSIAFGSLTLHDTYTLDGDLLTRRLRVENTSPDKVQLTGLRLGLRGVCIGDPAACVFEAPANAIRPRLPLTVAASQPDPHNTSHPTPDLHFAPGAPFRYGSGLADAPDVGPGLLVVHNPDLAWSLLTWYHSAVEAATPWVGGDGTHATLSYDVHLAGWLAPGASLEAGTQFIALHAGDYDSALAFFRQTVSASLQPLYGDFDRAADWTGIYEAHPGMFGGFEGFRRTLPRLSEMGFDTLYLLPVMQHRNKSGRAWDENWEADGSPYAMLDFETFEPTLGSELQFEELVEAAHALGMRLLMDFVAQGCALESHHVADHPDWFARDESGAMIHSHGWNDTWSLDWANPAYQDYMLSWATRFVRQYGVDGFRVDAPHGKEPNWDRNLPYHASQTSLGITTLLDRLGQDIRRIRPSAALLCELFGPLWARSHDISCDYHPWAMLWQVFNRQLTPAEFGEYLRDYWSVMPQAADGTPYPRVCFTETHDTRSWPAYALRGSAIEKAMLGILVMSGFVPMIWAGMEDGQEDFIQGLLLARRENRVLRRGRFLFNAVRVDDLGHYRRDQGHAPADHVFTVLRHDDQTALFGLASLFPELVTYQFALPVERLPLDPAATYRLRDLISYKWWDEHGKDTWTGEELRSLRLTPRMYTPYIFRLEAVEG